MEGRWGWALFGVIWALAAFGVIAKTTIGFRYPRLSTWLYLAMGWLIVIAIKPLRESLTAQDRAASPPARFSTPPVCRSTCGKRGVTPTRYGTCSCWPRGSFRRGAERRHRALGFVAPG